MLNNNLKNIFVFLLVIFSSSIYADYDFKDDLESGKAVVLIINANENSKSEQYADWSHYLNEFSSGAGKNYTFHKLSADKLRRTILNGEKFKEKYSMIFMKKGKPSYFYSGPIVEPQVYKFVHLTFSGKPIQPKYLNQFSPEIVTIEFKSCN
ncbi:MAG: hypothetical protein OQK75_05615 [Gammaproteobacteria bacterium]|nr:hypothetical protein [Gammaproteobacteria bacterium]MCW9030912.1 hypothetical protein [Gammaproteobacteria bacterium]